MDVSDLILRLATALGIGLLIGLERGWRRRKARPGSRAAGVRTFTIGGLLGGVFGAIATSLGAGSITTGILLGLGFVAFSVVFALSAYAVIGDPRLAAAIAVAAAGILALREPLHGWVEKITWPELRSGLVLLTMTFIALPILPNQPVGPFGGVNPREVWLIAIALAFVSFLGYLAIKYFGARRGTLIAAAAGGLVSSTAVTIANAHRAANGEASARLLAAGVAVATAISFVRVLGITAALNASLLPLIAPTLLAAVVAALGYAAIAEFWRDPGATEPQTVKLRNPFGFWSVIGLALALGAVIVVGRAAGEMFGAVGAIVSAIAIGVADVDSVTVSMTNLTPEPLGPAAAAVAILAGVASDTASKVAIGTLVGRGRFAFEIAIMALACFLVGGAAAFATSALHGG
jgi:uncharacterized membrane protein (DUF4010 family)